MENFLEDFGLALMIGGVFGFILMGACCIAEKCGLSDKLANMFSDDSEDEE